MNWLNSSLANLLKKSLGGLFLLAIILGPSCLLSPSTVHASTADFHSHSNHDSTHHTDCISEHSSQDLWRAPNNTISLSEHQKNLDDTPSFAILTSGIKFQLSDEYHISDCILIDKDQRSPRLLVTQLPRSHLG